ncbi:MAG: hypothetical protein RLZZ214_1872 [Verrucomicrobiota bacterium]
MTSEQRVTLIQRVVFFALLIAVGIAAWFYQRSPDEEGKVAEKVTVAEKAPVKTREGVEKPVATNHIRVPKDPLKEDIDALVKKVVSPDNGVAIIHFHLPGDPASEQLADTFNLIQKKYGKLVSVTRVGFTAQPKDWEAQKGIKLPYILMIADQENVFQFQGFWSYSKVEKKVEEVIFGLRRVGKDWRPVVPGMAPKSR